MFGVVIQEYSGDGGRKLCPLTIALPELKAWELARENEMGLKVRMYNVDNGELRSHEMAAWLKSWGVNQ